MNDIRPIRPPKDGCLKPVLGVVALLIALGAMLASAQNANAAVDPANPCNLTGWFVNDDEKDRAPKATLAGLEFEDRDLIHHASAPIPLDRLRPGWFTATPAPDQPSFFSVEVRDRTTDGYATLRWDKTTAKWVVVTTGPAAGTFTSENPADFIGLQTKFGKLTAATRVVTFGVGYTNSPAGTVKTTVKTVTFAARTYELSCPKEVDPSPSPSKTTTSPTATASPSKSATGTPTATPSKSSSTSPTSTASSSSSASPSSSTTTPPMATSGPSDSDPDPAALPTTGASLGGVILVGLGVVFLGGLTLFLVRKRKRRGINSPY